MSATAEQDERTRLTFGGLLPVLLVHDIEASAEQAIEERALACRLRTKDGDDVVREAFVCEFPFLHVLVQMCPVSLSAMSACKVIRGLRKLLVLVDCFKGLSGLALLVLIDGLTNL